MQLPKQGFWLSFKWDPLWTVGELKAREINPAESAGGEGVWSRGTSPEAEQRHWVLMVLFRLQRLWEKWKGSQRHLQRWRGCGQEGGMEGYTLVTGLVLTVTLAKQQGNRLDRGRRRETEPEKKTYIKEEGSWTTKMTLTYAWKVVEAQEYVWVWIVLPESLDKVKRHVAFAAITNEGVWLASTAHSLGGQLFSQSIREVGKEHFFTNGTSGVSALVWRAESSWTSGPYFFDRITDVCPQSASERPQEEHLLQRSQMKGSEKHTGPCGMGPKCSNLRGT